jgi:UDP-2,3-diacylglucosamine pyrophosphatase LpxH
LAASYRTLWISDVHLGTAAARAAELLAFLDEVRADKIYLVGDIVDLKRLQSRPVFPEQHVAVVTELVRIAGRGTEVVFIPGNHDHQFRALTGRDICGIPVALEATHVTPSGRRLLVTHGDVLDGRIRRGTNLEKFGAAAYFLLMEADVLFNRLRRRLGRNHLPISAAVKRRLRSANEYIRRFETVAAGYAEERGYDGIVCGHIHRPGIRRIGGCLYANDGDWVEHRTALAESADGTLEILNWQLDAVHVEAPLPAPSLAA